MLDNTILRACCHGFKGKTDDAVAKFGRFYYTWHSPGRAVCHNVQEEILPGFTGEKKNFEIPVPEFVGPIYGLVPGNCRVVVEIVLHFADIFFCHI